MWHITYDRAHRLVVLTAKWKIEHSYKVRVQFLKRLSTVRMIEHSKENKEQFLGDGKAV